MLAYTMYILLMYCFIGVNILYAPEGSGITAIDATAVAVPTAIAKVTDLRDTNSFYNVASTTGAITMEPFRPKIQSAHSQDDCCKQFCIVCCANILTSIIIFCVISLFIGIGVYWFWSPINTEIDQVKSFINTTSADIQQLQNIPNQINSITTQLSDMGIITHQLAIMAYNISLIMKKLGV